jgi:hypothetical protein
MKRIWLRNKRKYALVDDEDFERVKKYRWQLHHSGYAVATVRFSGQRKHIAMHRFILQVQGGVSTDHINQNKRDNRRQNLRPCTPAQNVCNVKRRKNNSSGYTGVHFHKHNKRWVAYIGRKPRIYLGSFGSAEKAARAYNEAAMSRFKEFACLNQIPGRSSG